MAKMAVVGSGGLVEALTAAGFAPVQAATADDLKAALARLARDRGTALVVVGESLAADADETIAAFRQDSQAMLLVLPDGPAPKHVGYDQVRKIIEQAAGADLLGRAAESAV